MICYCFFFFFSSRRRHTISDRDWSSDVCSSDLVGIGAAQQLAGLGKRRQPLANRRIGFEPGFDMAPLVSVELAVEIGNQRVVTVPLHFSHSRGYRRRRRADAAALSAHARGGS